MLILNTVEMASGERGESEGTGKKNRLVPGREEAVGG